MLAQNIHIRKMQAHLGEDGYVRYFLEHASGRINMNALIGQKIFFQFLQRHCLGCGKKITTFCAQGYCGKCFYTRADCDRCMVSPELCHFSRGTCRDHAYAQQYCFHVHHVYLAFTSHLKVGISRNYFRRWIDQGAVAAIPVLQCKDRLSSGLAEVHLKKFFRSMTIAKKMLAMNNLQESSEILQKIVADINIGKEKVYHEFADNNQATILPQENIIFLKYPYNANIFSSNLQKIRVHTGLKYTGQLQGIKGQYLVFDSGYFNCATQAGYFISIGKINA